MKEKLNPCPFCGGEAVHYAPSMRDMANGDCYGSIVCKNCDVFMQSDSDFDNDDLVKRWNTRPFECESWYNAMSEQKAYNAEAVKRVDMLTAENEELNAEKLRLLKAIHVIAKNAVDGLNIGIDFIGAGLDGMTGGQEEYDEMVEIRDIIAKYIKIQERTMKEKRKGAKNEN